MKISYFDLNEIDTSEDYSINPVNYGGGRIFAAAAKQIIPNFHIFSKKESFINCTEKDNTSNCHTISQEKIDKLMNGYKVSEILPECKDSDIYIHHNHRCSLNLEGCKTDNELCWPIVWRQSINEKIKHLAFFDYKNEEPVLLNNNHKIYNVVIGPKIEPFKEYKKEDFIFQCNRHCNLYSSIKIAELCNKNNIKIIFSGPIEKDYPLLNYINNKNSFYIGKISLEEKIKHIKLCKFNVQLQGVYPICMTLSSKECLSYGTPIIAINHGNWPQFIKNGINGFLINNANDFLSAWEQRNNIKQFSCYESVLPHSEENMINSFLKAFNSIIKDNCV